MHNLLFLDDLVIILLAAVVIIMISRPLRIPSIVGFLLTGILIGPSGLNIVAETSIIQAFAEIGVVLLLFVIGLEFSLSLLRSIWRQFFVAGSLQVVMTIGVVIAISGFSEFALGERIFFGFLVALSSTAIVLKLLADRSEMDTPHGKLMIGILLFQDFCMVPMIVLTPLLGGAGASVDTILLRLGLSVIAVVVIFLVARPILARLFEQIVKTQVKEAFLLGSLLICLLLSVATASLGFSYALGAFIAGLLVSETQYHLEVSAEITSFRDLFTSLFFISIGMLLNRPFILENMFTVLMMGIGILLVKAFVVFPIAIALKSSARTAIISSLSLAQVGEFSFVLAQVGLSVGLMNDNFNQHFLGASVLSMLVSPLIIGFAPSFAEKTQHLVPLRRNADDFIKSDKSLQDHVVLGGFGVNGRNLVRVLKETGIPHVVVETDADSMHMLKQVGSPSVFGDITRKEILERCHIERARSIVLTISDPAATRTAVRLARALNPNLHIIVRTRLVAEVDGLIRLGANEVIPEEFETSIEIFTRVLDHYHLPRNVINAQIQIIRDENYSILRGVSQTAQGLDRVARYLTAGTSDIFLVTDDCRAMEKSLRELDISEKTGASLIAVVRNEKPFITPSPDFKVEAGDILVLVGNHASMDKAFQYLSKSE